MKTFDKKVNWSFKIAIDGHGRNCKEALVSALENELRKIEMDYHPNDLEAIENHEVVAIDQDGNLREGIQIKVRQE